MIVTGYARRWRREAGFAFVWFGFLADGCFWSCPFTSAAERVSLEAGALATTNTQFPPSPCTQADELSTTAVTSNWPLVWLCAAAAEPKNRSINQVVLISFPCMPLSIASRSPIDIASNYLKIEGLEGVEEFAARHQMPESQNLSGNCTGRVRKGKAEASGGPTCVPFWFELTRSFPGSHKACCDLYPARRLRGSCCRPSVPVPAERDAVQLIQAR